MGWRHVKPNEQDLKVMEAASRLETGGIATFTAHFFSPEEGHPRWDLVWVDQSLATDIFSPEWDDRVNPDNYDLDYERGDYVPWLPLSWQAVIAHDKRLDVTAIAAVGTGKTIGVGAALLYWAAMVPGFKAMNVAPLGWQAKQMYDAIKMELLDWDNRDSTPRHGHRLIAKFVERPYPKITLFNGSTIEFMSADEQGSKIYSWSGDVIVVDEADKLHLAHTNLADVLGNLGTRMRGQVGGRARMGKLIVLGNAGYDPELWERFDVADEMPEDYLSIGLTIYDNPLITSAQLAAIERRIVDPDKRRQLLLNERPLPKGKEFTPELLNPCRSQALDDLLAAGLQAEAPGFTKEEQRRAGVVRWVIPPNTYDRYILVGDPGQANPPDRNSAVVVVLKVTNFPLVPAELAAFHWISGNGSYWPFIHQMEDWYREYRPIYAAFDATGVQKGFDELVFTQRGLLMEGVQLANRKMQTVLALKLIMGKELLLLPRGVQGIWTQLAGWRMPDTKLRQDIASALFIAGDVMNRLFVIDQSEQVEELEDGEAEATGGRPYRGRRRRVLRRTPNRRR